MQFLITGTDSIGRIIFRCETAAAARRKATLLAECGCDDVAITAPDGQRYPPRVFDQLPSDIDWSERRH
jgi:hypothetical protein